MKTWTVLMIVALLAATGFAEGTWPITTVGSDDLASQRIGWRPDKGRTEFGGYVIWMDGVAGPDTEGFGGGVYGTYDLVQNAEFNVLWYTVPVTWLVGGELGALEREDANEDAMAGLFTGISFGDERIRIGVEYHYLLDKDLWREFGDLNDSDGLFLSLQVRF
jgi:hypothetical protein